MKLICVDDVAQVVEYTVSLCQDLPHVDDARGFTLAREALEWARANPVDVAILDIGMPDMDGLTLAAHIRQARPDCAVIFLTAFAQFALDAYEVHPSGYLLKPVNAEALAREVAYAHSKMPQKPHARIEVQTFGGFEILVDGETLRFRRAKSKELLAFLVDKQGKGVTRREIFSALWEDGAYDHSQQKYLDVIVRGLRDALAARGVEDILEVKSGFLRIRPERLSCDLYRFLERDPAAVNAYRGQYMSGYPWAALSESWLSFSRDKESE
ncbi:MAG: response regulator [Clostridia bacterium]|nr:response regulator [Clostridia bacterium]